MIKSTMLSMAVLCSIAFSVQGLAESRPSIWLSEKDAGAVIGEAIGQISRMEDKCIEILSKDDIENYPKAAFYAFKYLEKIKSEKSMSIMYEKLLLEQKVEVYDAPVGDNMIYPAVQVLESIGQESVNGLIDYIAKHNTSIRYRNVAIGVLINIIGKERIIETINTVSKTYSPMQSEYGNYKRRLSDLKSEYEQWLAKSVEIGS